jgi:hypothetical protein
MWDEAFGQLIVAEPEQINALLNKSAALIRTPTSVERSFLCSFYTGLERIFECIVKDIDGRQPKGERWHAELLDQVAHRTNRRPAVISEDSRQRLSEYLAFRHLSRHVYVHDLVWDRMAHLVAAISQTWDIVRAEILQFVYE